MQGSVGDPGMKGENGDPGAAVSYYLLHIRCIKIYSVGVGGSCDVVGGSCDVVGGSCDVVGGSCDVVGGSCDVAGGSCDVVGGSCDVGYMHYNMLLESVALDVNYTWFMSPLSRVFLG